MIPRLDESQVMLRDAARGACGKLARHGTDKRASLTDAWRSFVDLGWTAVALPESVGGLNGSLLDAGIIAPEMGRGVLLNHYPETIAMAQALAEAAGDSPSAEIRDLLEGVAEGRTAILLRQPLEAPVKGAEGTLAPCGAADAVVIELVGEVLCAVPLLKVATRPVKTTRRDGDLLVEDAPAVLLKKGVRLLEGAAARRAWDRATAIRSVLSAYSLIGAAHAAHSIAFDYAGVRAQFGHLINNYQAVQHSLVDVFSTLEAGELMVLSALGDLDLGAGPDAPSVTTAVAFVREQIWVAMIKTYDIMGGVGFMEEHPLSELTRCLLPVLASLGSTESCFEGAAAGVRRGAWL